MKFNKHDTYYQKTTYRRFSELEKIIPALKNAFSCQFDEELTFDDINLIKDEKEEEIEKISKKKIEDPTTENSNIIENIEVKNMKNENEDYEPSIVVCLKRIRLKEKLLRVNIENFAIFFLFVFELSSGEIL